MSCMQVMLYTRHGCENVLTLAGTRMISTLLYIVLCEFAIIVVKSVTSNNTIEDLCASCAFTSH